MTDSSNALRTIVILVGVLLLLPLIMMAFMMPMMGAWGWDHMWSTGMWDGTGGAWMFAWMLFILIATIAAIGYIILRLSRASSPDETDPALQELRKAYARGDLSDEEFERRRERLE